MSKMLFKSGYCFLLFLLFLSFSCSAQDRIVLLNGKEIVAKDIKVEDRKIVFHTDGKAKLKRVSTDAVFSIEYANGKQQVIYEKDPLEPNDLSAEEMRVFISGEQAANEYYHNHLNKVVAAVIGAAGGIFLNIYGVTAPAIYSTVVGSIPPRNQPGASTSMQDNPLYRDGYDTRATDRKIKNSLIYGYAGFIAGFAAFAIFGK